MEKKLKKLMLKKKEISGLTAEEMEKVTGGLLGSRMMCLQTKADRGCTKHTRCTHKDYPYVEAPYVTIICF